MKGIIFFYSGSGNTKLCCRYISNKINKVDFTLHSMVKSEIPDLTDYQIIGFAAFTDFWGPSYLVQQFIKKLPFQNDKPAFVFNTFGAITGKTLTVLEKWISERGFKVISGHSLHTPENYPPMIINGRGYENSPNEKELEAFNHFISGLDNLCSQLKNGQSVPRIKISLTLFNRLLPVFPRTKARSDMGEKYVVEDLCTECSVCEKICPYEAIVLDPKPKFDIKKCYGCWACFHHCPTKAIYTKKIKGTGHYPSPNEQLKKKLQIVT